MSSSPHLLALTRTLGVALALALLPGCPATKLYKEGLDLEEAGKEFKAADRYLDALDTNENHKKAMEALRAVAEEAYREELAVAEGFEKDAKYPAALDAYRLLDTYLDRVRGVDALDFSAINTNEKIGEMQDASAFARYKNGEERLAARDWEGAVEEYEAAQSFRPRFKDTAEKVAIAQYGWAESELSSNKYRSAAKHFSLAVDSGGPGFKDAAKRSGALYLALGRHFIKADRCRSAVRDLRHARDLGAEGDVLTDLQTAEACAVTPVAFLPFENPTGVGLAGMALGDTLADQAAANVKAKASEFVRIMERSALDAILAEQGISSSGLAGGGKSNVKGVRYLVLGKLTQVRLVTNKPKATKVTFETRQAYDCQKTSSDGKAYAGTCYQDVKLSYSDHKADISLDIVGSLRVVDVLTGEQLAAPSVQSTAKDAIHYADNFEDAAGNGVAIAKRGRTGGIEVDGSYIELSEARTSLKDEGELANQVVADIAKQAAEATLKVVDVERKAVDPTSLAIDFGK